MCSFLFIRTRVKIGYDALDVANFHARFRGPDRTVINQEISLDGRQLTFVHNLLDISGTTCAQPLCKGEQGNRLWSIFNGEIYNYRTFADVKCDSQCLIPAFRQFGESMGSELDGEFAIAIYDENKNECFVFTDPFLTKPIYIGEGRDPGDFGVATCATTLSKLGFARIQMAEPNSTYTISFCEDSVSISRRFPVFDFDITQHKENYHDWERAFLAAVEKRARHGAQKPAVFLSSGYDSGGICLALNKLRVKYDTFSIVAGENKYILNQRIAINKSSGSCDKAFRFAGLSPKDRLQMTIDVQANVENFTYQHEDAPGFITALHNDHGAVGANFIAAQSRRNGRFVNLSGSGADEILSDYGLNGKKIYHHSEFGGLFPDNLEGFFPWKKFYGDSQRSYLFKDEFILGRHGIEGRYPYLDKMLVQEFLWLAPSLKNRAYKAPLEAFLDEYSYPFELAIKRGFIPDACISSSHSIAQKIKSLIVGSARCILEKATIR
jgi:asparagine synthetase B (glutamine-hydrolysing)